MKTLLLPLYENKAMAWEKVCQLMFAGRSILPIVNPEDGPGKKPVPGYASVFAYLNATAKPYAVYLDMVTWKDKRYTQWKLKTAAQLMSEYLAFITHYGAKPKWVFLDDFFGKRDFEPVAATLFTELRLRGVQIMGNPGGALQPRWLPTEESQPHHLQLDAAVIHEENVSPDLKALKFSSMRVSPERLGALALNVKNRKQAIRLAELWPGRYFFATDGNDNNQAGLWSGLGKHFDALVDLV